MISIVYDVTRYRERMGEVVRDGDVVVEIGPHLGQSTLPALEKASLVVAIDKGRQSETRFATLRKDHDNLVYVSGDVRSFETLKAVRKHTKKCDVFACDMGGGRYPDTVFKVWATWAGVLTPRDSLIRNRGLAEFLQRASVDDDTITKGFEDDGWLSTWGRATPYVLKKQLEEFKHYVDITKPLE